jgi:plastocyanin
MHRTKRNRLTTYLAAATAVVVAGVLFAVAAPVASATPRTVTIPAGQDAFSPQNLGTITVGDTITFKNNNTHNVVSANIPAGAAAFTSPIMSGAAATFTYTPTVPGNYRYLCTLHSNAAAANAATQSAGAMVGQFTVVAASPTPTPTTAPTTVAPTVPPTVAPTTVPPTTMPPMTMPPTTAVPTTVPTVVPTGAPGATPRTINIPSGQKSFAPQDLGTINVGDTITWNNNDTHNVVSANIPAGAAAFTSPIMSGTATFSLKVTVPGNYRYVCTLHSNAAAANATPQSAGEMVGQFTVAGAGTPVPTATVVPTGTPTVAPTGTPTAPAPANGNFRVKVKGHHGAIEVEAEARDRGHHGAMTFAASAVAHFSTGDVTVQLPGHGDMRARGDIRIPAGQSAGQVDVDVIIVCDGVQTVITKTVSIKGSSRDLANDDD